MELIKLLLETDEPSLLEKMRKILVSTSDKIRPKNIVGYKPNGEPISQGELEQHMKESIGQIEKGEVISQEDLIRDSENW